jgi:hypothetical protein
LNSRSASIFARTSAVLAPSALATSSTFTGRRRQELVQRRIEQPDRHGQPVHRTEDADEVGVLDRAQLVERACAVGGVAGEDQLAHGEDPRGLEEHVFGSAQADALGTERARDRGVVRRVGVGAHREPAHAVGPFHQLDERGTEFGRHGRAADRASPRRCRRRA